MNRKLSSTVLAIIVALGMIVLPVTGRTESVKKTVLASTFPIYQAVRNIVHDRTGIKVELLLPGQLGCPHDYVLTPQDMRKLTKADFLVVNGLGMEEFLGVPVRKANSGLVIIDSSAGISGILKYSGGHHHHGHDHYHSNVNPHLFASPRMMAKVVMTVAKGLSRADPDGADKYLKNARIYATRLNSLADEMLVLGKRLENNRIIQPHGVFDYLARDMGLKIASTMLAHGRTPSASKIIRLAKVIKKKNVGAIITEPQYPEKIATLLSRETGVPVVMLDPVATGSKNARLNHYETVMRQNMKTLEQALGVK